jgi:16S rRNA (cytosine967-C5)-methyltransferase
VFSASPARTVAYRVVRRVFEEGAFADRAFRGEAVGLAPRDRALAMRLAYGTVQRKGSLAWVAGRMAKGRLEPGVRAALWLGLYQLIYTEIADHAAIAESVELAKPSPGHRVVNAVLRRVQREGVELPADDTPAGAAVRHSHPEWVVKLWWDWIGPERTRALLAADNEPAEHALRVNTLVGGEFEGARDPELPEARILEGAVDVFATPEWAAGAVMAQSRASMHVARMVDPRPGERVLDLCAAPGGKTTHLAALMGGEGEIVAVERHEGRAAALRATCERMKASIVEVRVGDAKDPPVEGEFDRILVDPPCTGLGTLRSHPDLRWRVTSSAVERLAGEQDAILAAARRHLRPGGRLVYSVCTLSPGEERLAGDVQRRLWPHEDGSDGFYIAADG